MILGEDRVMLLLFPLLHVNESVARARHQHCGCTLVEGVVRDLEVTDATLNISLASDACLSDKLLTVPIPEEDLPVRLAGQRHDHLLVFGAEGARDELLRVIRVNVLNLLWKRLSLLLAGHIVDGELALVGCSAPFANCNILLALGKCNVSDCLSVVRTCNRLKFVSGSSYNLPGMKYCSFSSSLYITMLWPATYKSVLSSVTKYRQSFTLVFTPKK